MDKIGGPNPHALRERIFTTITIKDGQVVSLENFNEQADFGREEVINMILNDPLGGNRWEWVGEFGEVAEGVESDRLEVWESIAIEGIFDDGAHRIFYLDNPNK
jgi:hypothetical protein